MSTTTIIVLIFGIAALGLAAFLYYQKLRSERLHGRFGPEYDRTVSELGDRRKAESELERRARRVERFHIRNLSPQERDRFAESWRGGETRGVGQPGEGGGGGAPLFNGGVGGAGGPGR